MKPITEEAKQRYFTELRLRLRRAGFDTQPERDGMLPVVKDGLPLCQVNGRGGVQFRPEDMEPFCGRDTLDQAVDIAVSTSEYMSALEAAPFLKAVGLSEQWKLLGEYNGRVFAGHITEFGAGFATWDRTFDGAGVTVGHYFGDYTKAKKDFAIRSGLFPRDEAFTREQLSDLYAHTRWALDNNEALSYEDCQRAEDILRQIEQAVPEAAEQAQRFQEQNNLIEQTM